MPMAVLMDSGDRHESPEPDIREGGIIQTMNGQVFRCPRQRYPCPSRTLRDSPVQQGPTKHRCWAEIRVLRLFWQGGLEAKGEFLCFPMTASYHR